ncbi:phage tail tip lysozyme [Ligilactobacillus salivarius]|uniref:phage tail tip lysozyme n=1 Tax=Ligilactobacillus salivarius TaxID=1624 RepID=UPI0021518243|nr:phage tail tip lysozyme [Ligilactobacillus salivarius]MDH4960074.1 phage tail tip lysozyme [Ligilactobacillus salivarius]UUY24382.1 phage tail tip lysozyme [Ligilactobacillus salivarius]
MKNLKVWIIAGIGAGSSLLIFMMIIIMIIFNVNLNSSCDDSESAANNPTSATGASGSWEKKGSKAYNTAKEVFDFWVKKGMSGAGAAGIVGNIGGAENTGFVLDQKEIGGGSGGGLYQFTPYTKYLNDPKSDKSWSAQNQSEVVISLEPGTVKSYSSRTKTSSPGDAATNWMNMYERPSEKAKESTNGARRSAAEKFYEMFGGASITANESILGGTVDGANAGEQAQSDEESVNCGDDSTSVPGSWIWPFKSVPKSGPSLDTAQKFGNDGGFRTNSFHDGVDFGDATYNGDIHAVHGGKISKIVKPGEYGVSFYLVWETTDDGYGIAYQEFGNMDDIFVKEGDTVKTGDKIGVSRPGGQEYSHLHLGISKEKDLGKALGKSFTDDGTWLNPVDVIKKGLENSGAGD